MLPVLSLSIPSVTGEVAGSFKLMQNVCVCVCVCVCVFVHTHTHAYGAVVYGLYHAPPRLP